jgi:hypothetical protein
MTALKLTLSAAMRARDVSRPHPEHLAEAETAEAAEAAEAAEGDAAGAEARQPHSADGSPVTDGPPPKRTTKNVRRFKLR